ncbi:MAG: hypothetical protein NC311_09945 [Muribaculaceae bacterium]|nr:hypothetical protein [Muribaculaceae bacterium]
MTIDYNQIFTLLGIMLGSGGIGTFVGRLSRNERKRDKADADGKVQEAQSLMIRNYEARIKDLHENISRQNVAEKRYMERISEQNHAINSKTEQIRSLTQKLWEAEQGLNRANERITALTEERDNYRNWHCRKGDCPHREPPNPGILHQQFHA